MEWKVGCKLRNRVIFNRLGQYSHGLDQVIEHIIVDGGKFLNNFHSNGHRPRAIMTRRNGAVVATAAINASIFG